MVAAKCWMANILLEVANKALLRNIYSLALLNFRRARRYAHDISGTPQSYFDNLPRFIYFNQVQGLYKHRFRRKQP